MITHQFFVKHLGFDEQKALSTYNSIKNHPFTSISGILRQTEDTLAQKFNFYKSELGFSYDKVIEDFRLLTYDTTSDETKPTSVRSKIKYFRDELGFENKHFESTMSIFSNNLEVLKEKVDYLKKAIGFQAKHIQQVPTILNYDLETIKQKVAFYKQKLGFTSKEFKDYPGIFTLDCENPDNPNSIFQKLEFYEKELGLNASHFRKVPCLLSFDTISEPDANQKGVKAKIKFYAETLGYTPKQFQLVPALLNHDITSDESVTTSVKYKIKFLQNTLGFEPEHFQKAPEIFGYDCASDDIQNEKSLKAKIKFYQEVLGFDSKILRENPVLFHFDCVLEDSPTSVKTKIKKLYEIGLSNDDIKNNIQLLLTPAEDIKDKFALWSTLFPDRSFMDLTSWFVTRTDKVYARARFLVDDYKIKQLRPGHLNISEKQYQLRFKSTSEDAMKKYPLDEKIIDSFYADYQTMALQPPLQKD